MMISGGDLWRAAWQLIEQHGVNAPMLAVRWADEMRAAGDAQGRAVWLGILGAVRELQSTNPSGSVH